jgi:hypothetical protein
LTVAYAYDPFTNVASIRSDDPALPPLVAQRADTVQPDSVIGAACTVVYFLASAFLPPDTRGKTREEIEGFFARPAAK